MAGLFSRYRSAHHPDADLRLRLATGYLRGEIAGPVVAETLKRRDRELWLEMESSALAGILIEPLSSACPDKRFVLTIRDVFSWCNSWIDHNLNRGGPPSASSPWGSLDRTRLRVDDFEPTEADEPLTSLGLPPLACFFQLWTSHNQRVLESVPAERLFVVQTESLSSRIPEIAAWAGVDVATLRADQAWLQPTSHKHRVLESLDEQHVRDTAQRLCGALMAEQFPIASWPPR